MRKKIMKQNVEPSVIKKQKPYLLTEQTTFKGPLPHPDVLARYKEITPDAPERILKEFEQNSQHIRETRELALKADIAVEKRGQFFAFILATVLLGITALCLYLDKDIGAFLSGAAFICLLIGSFLPKKKK